MTCFVLIQANNPSSFFTRKAALPKSRTPKPDAGSSQRCWAVGLIPEQPPAGLLEPAEPWCPRCFWRQGCWLRGCGKHRASLPFPSAPRVPDFGRCSLQKQRQPELLGASQKPAGPSSPAGLQAARALGAQRAKLPSMAGGRLVWGCEITACW